MACLRESFHPSGLLIAGHFFDPNLTNSKEPTMNYAIAGGAIVGAAQLNESLLDTITRRLRTGWRSLINTLNQRSQP